MTAIRIQDCIDQILENGYCVLRGHFPVDAVEACRKAFIPIADAYLAAHADKPNLEWPNQPHYTLPLPFARRSISRLFKRRHGSRLAFRNPGGRLS